MENPIKRFKIELIKQDLKVQEVADGLGISKPTLLKRVANPELFTLENIKNLKQMKLNLIKE